jgi:hypothetical protein
MDVAVAAALPHVRDAAGRQVSAAGETDVRADARSARRRASLRRPTRERGFSLQSTREADK